MKKVLAKLKRKKKRKIPSVSVRFENFLPSNWLNYLTWQMPVCWPEDSTNVLVLLGCLIQTALLRQISEVFYWPLTYDTAKWLRVMWHSVHIRYAWYHEIYKINCCVQLISTVKMLEFNIIKYVNQHQNF